MGTAADIQAVIIVAASGNPRGLFEFSGAPALNVTRSQTTVSSLAEFLPTPIIKVVTEQRNITMV